MTCITHTKVRGRGKPLLNQDEIHRDNVWEQSEQMYSPTHPVNQDKSLPRAIITREKCRVVFKLFIWVGDDKKGTMLSGTWNLFIEKSIQILSFFFLISVYSIISIGQCMYNYPT